MFNISIYIFVIIALYFYNLWICLGKLPIFALYLFFFIVQWSKFSKEGEKMRAQCCLLFESSKWGTPASIHHMNL